MARPAEREVVETARAMFEAGASLAEIAKAVGCARSSISVWAKRQGWARSEDHANSPAAKKTEAARERAEVRWQRRREAIVDGFLDDIAALRDQLFAEAMVHHFTKDGDFATGELGQPTFADKQRIVTSMAILVDKVQLLTGQATARTEQLSGEEVRQRAAVIVDELAARRRQKAAG